MKNWIHECIMHTITWYLKKCLREVRKSNPEYYILEIDGTGAEYPDYILFSDNIRGRERLVKA